MAMMQHTIRCDNTDAFDAVHVACEMVEALPWPHRESARDQLEEIITSGRGVRMEYQDGMMVGYASNELLAFVAKVEGLT
jgi:hypothetical protein